MYCKICGNHLYEKIDFRILFRINYEVHLECEKYLNEEIKVEIIPIDNNIIEFRYLVDKNLEINTDYIFMKKGLDLLKDLEDGDDWSIVFYYDESFEISDDLTKYLFLKLASNKIIFISETAM